MGKHSKRNHNPNYKETQRATEEIARRVFIHNPPPIPKEEQLLGKSPRHPPGKILKFSDRCYEVQASGSLKRIA
jgi:hypothetical protein